jgi:asparagine synthase (glutamine-hydrolysing)
MHHRGPDGGGVLLLTEESGLNADDELLTPGTFAFVAQRSLNTGTHSVFEGKPAISADGRFALSLDGSILNMSELRGELQHAGVPTVGDSPEKVLVQCFSRWGIDFVEKLTGAFALSLIDLKTRQLHLARDEFGVKTLYYYREESGLVYSSDLTALLEWPHVPRRAHPDNLFAFLRHGSTSQDGGTLFADIKQVLPGTYMTIDVRDAGQPRVVSYRRHALPDQIDVSFEEATDKVRNLFLESIQINMNPDAPVGASLSGGMDSTAIVTSMRRIVGANSPIHTFSYVVPGVESLNEDRWINLVNERVDAIPHKVSATSQDFARDLESATRSSGEPIAGTGQYVQRRVFEAVREAGIPVVLDGVGGDGMTGGHSYYVVDRVFHSIRNRDLRTSAQLMFNLLRKEEVRSSRALTAHALSYLPPNLHRALRNALNQEMLPFWLDKKWFIQSGISPALPVAPQGTRPLHKHMAEIVGSDRLSRYAERAAAASSAESRLPFLYRPLANYLWSLPPDYLISREGEGRMVFRAAMRGIMPNEILERKDKIGFQAPENQWLAEQAEWVSATLRDGMEAGAPIRAIDVPDDLASRKPAMATLARCVAVAVWARVFDVSFD